MHGGCNYWLISEHTSGGGFTWGGREHVRRVGFVHFMTPDNLKSRIFPKKISTVTQRRYNDQREDGNEKGPVRLICRPHASHRTRMVKDRLQCWSAGNKVSPLKYDVVYNCGNEEQRRGDRVTDNNKLAHLLSNVPPSVTVIPPEVTETYERN